MNRLFHISLVAGARPNFMKVAPVYHALAAKREAALAAWVTLRISIVHTGQHYDENMSDVFFRDLGIPRPDRHLEVGSGSHAEQTAKIMIAFEKILLKDRPDLVAVVGDVNSTIACALTAKKLGVKVAHVEAGLRSFDMGMPEEINRKLTDAISDLLFVTEDSGIRNLRAEGVPEERIFLVGNVMIDTLLRNLARIESGEFAPTGTMKDFCGAAKQYAVLTLHRPSNVDQRESLAPLWGVIAMIARRDPHLLPRPPEDASENCRVRAGQHGRDNGRPRRLSGHAVCGERGGDGFDRLGRFGGPRRKKRRCSVCHVSPSVRTPSAR